MIYKERLKELRESKDLKQIELNQILNIDNTSFCHYENEDVIIPVKHLNTLCNYFNVSFDYIFSFTKTKQYSKSMDIIDNKISGKRLKEFRKENKLTQTNLAHILNSGRTTIAGYENGTYSIATPFLYTICSKYHISADYLLGKIDEPKYLV